MSILFGLVAASFAATSLVFVEKEFRQDPVWYWANEASQRCVRMSTEDIINKAAPAAIKSKNIDKDLECGIDLTGNLEEAHLRCGKELIGIYYATAPLCKESLKKK